MHMKCFAQHLGPNTCLYGLAVITGVLITHKKHVMHEEHGVGATDQEPTHSSSAP